MEFGTSETPCDRVERYHGHQEDFRHPGCVFLCHFQDMRGRVSSYLHLPTFHSPIHKHIFLRLLTPQPH